MNNHMCSPHIGLRTYLPFTISRLHKVCIAVWFHVHCSSMKMLVMHGRGSFHLASLSLIRLFASTRCGRHRRHAIRTGQHRNARDAKARIHHLRVLDRLHASPAVNRQMVHGPLQVQAAVTTPAQSTVIVSALDVNQ